MAKGQGLELLSRGFSESTYQVKYLDNVLVALEHTVSLNLKKPKEVCRDLKLNFYKVLTFNRFC